MPLPDPAPRKQFHTRQIDMKGYAREDGLWDIEGHMTDVKCYTFNNKWRGDVEPGTPVHDMWMRLTMDDSLTIVDIEAVTDHSPFEMCPLITPNFKRLVGLQIGPGWNLSIRKRVGGIEGCTHLVEMLGPMATVAYQTIKAGGIKRRNKLYGIEPIPKEARDPDAPRKRPGILNTCHAWSTKSPAVKDELPEFYEGE